MANINIPHHMKDSRWLQLEVCREAQRNKCTRSDEECKFAHPPPHVEIQNGRVVACYDSIKGRCNRENPPCKYYHPPQHLKDQLLINGRNHLAMKNILVQQMQMQSIALQPQLQMQPQLSLMAPYYNPAFSTGANAYLGSTPAFLASASSPGPSGSSHSDTTSASTSMSNLTSSLLQQQMQQQQQQQQQHSGSKSRMDRLEVCREFSRGSCRRSEQECKYAHPAEHVQVTDNMVVVCMDSLKGKCGRDACRYFHPPAHLVQQLKSRQSVNTPATGNSSSAVAANAALGLNVYAPSAASVAAVPVPVALPAAVSVPVNVAAAAAPSMGNNSEYEQAFQAAMAAQAVSASPLLAAAAMLNQKQAMAALMAAATQQVQAQMQAAAAASLPSVYAHSSAVNQAATAAAITPSLNALAAAGWSDFVSQGQKGLKRKASYEQDNELVFHGLAASVKRQTTSPLSAPSLALYQQQQHQQSLQAAAAAMYGIGPLLSNFQHSLSMQHYTPLHHPSIPGVGLGGVSPGGGSGIEGQPESSQDQESPNEDPPSSS